METIIFAPATFNLAETTRMIEVANYLKNEVHCIFFGFSKTYKHLIEDAGFTFYLFIKTYIYPGTRETNDQGRSNEVHQTSVYV